MTKTRAQKSPSSINASTKNTRVALKATVGLLCLLQVTSCGKGSSGSPNDLAAVTEMNLGCQSFEDEFWDGLYRFALAEKTFPTSPEVRSALARTLVDGRLKNLSESDRARIVEAVVELYDLLTNQMTRRLSVDPRDFQVVLETMSALEMGDRTTPQKSALQDLVRAKFNEIERIAGDTAATVACPAPTPHPPEVSLQANTLFSHWKANRHPAVYGGLKALAVSYQSCSAGTKPALTAETADVQGISITGTHSNGVGMKREITDIKALLGSHPYLRGYVRPSSSCFDVTKSPMIYDYGGKPYATDSKTSTINFFKDEGTGTKVLGIDCSGYITASLASAGLKLKSSGRLKAISAKGVSASMYKDWSRNGLDCLSAVTFKPDSGIKAGDILASSGHIVMVTDVGSDPLGIEKYTKESECTTSNIKTSKFNFTILQSAPIKGGIGIDKIQMADYLADGGSMATAMVTHAINACKARTKGTSVTTSSSSASLVRHKGTSVCKDTEIKLEREACVTSCAMTTASALPDPTLDRHVETQTDHSNEVKVEAVEEPTQHKPEISTEAVTTEI